MNDNISCAPVTSRTFISHPKLLAIDLDGTLLHSDHTVSQRTVATLIRAQQAGVKVAIASGRPTYGTMPTAKALLLKQYGGFIMSYNGGEIFDCASDTRLFATSLEDTVKPTIYNFAKEHHLTLMTYIGSEVVTENGEDEFVRYSSMRNSMHVHVVNDFLSAAAVPITKCIIVGQPEQLVAVEHDLQEELGNQAEAFRSEPFFLEIVPCGIDKARGLKELLQATGIAREDCMAFGDGFNDVSMIAYAGIGVAMGNAQPEVKSLASIVTLINEEDGVAAVVEHTFFS